MKTTLWLAFLWIASTIIVNGQANNQSADALLVAPSEFKLLATNVSYQGETCSAGDKNDKAYADSSRVIREGDKVYYQSHLFNRYDRSDGLVMENFASKTCRVYPMFGLGEAAGWFKPNKGGGGTPNATGGLFRVGNALWMGSNGIGVAVFDLERNTWSRFDLKSSVVAGDHVFVNYADDNYVFLTRGEFPGASLHVYSVKQKRWLKLKAVSNRLVREYGYTTGIVQVSVDHRFFAKEKYLPLDWTFMGFQVAPIDHGNSYSFEKKFSEAKTVFEISKSQLERVFRKASIMNAPPGESSKRNVH